MAAGLTYTPITSTTLANTASSVTFSSIASTYTDLVLVANIKGSTGNYTRVQFNGDTGTNYSWLGISGDGTSATSFKTPNIAYTYLQGNALQTSTDFSYISTTHFMNYSNTTTYKTFVSRSSAVGSATDALVSLWRSTSAINSIYLYPNTGNFATGSTFTLYGITAA